MAAEFRLGTASSSDPGRRVPPLHLITDDETLCRRDFVPRAAELLRAGSRDVALHLRSRRVPARRLFEIGARLVPLARETGARLLFNDRVDLAMATRADGVQLGARSLSVPDARRLLGAYPIIGGSVHSEAEAARVARDGADFLIAGTLFPTPSHPGRAGAGTAWLAWLAALGKPVIGIGGITPERAAGVRIAGAFGVAVLRGVWSAERPTKTLRAYLAALEEGDRS